MSDADLWRRIATEIYSEGKLELIDEIFADDYVEHQEPPPGIPPGREGVRPFFEALRAAFPDLRCAVVQQMQDGDLHVGYVSVEGTMKGEFAGMPATGRHARWEEIHIGRFRGGKLVEHWGVADELGMLQQLGLAPAPGA